MKSGANGSWRTPAGTALNEEKLWNGGRAGDICRGENLNEKEKCLAFLLFYVNTALFFLLFLGLVAIIN